MAFRLALVTVGVTLGGSVHVPFGDTLGVSPSWRLRPVASVTLDLCFRWRLLRLAFPSALHLALHLAYPLALLLGLVALGVTLGVTLHRILSTSYIVHRTTRIVPHTSNIAHRTLHIAHCTYRTLLTPRIAYRLSRNSLSYICMHTARRASHITHRTSHTAQRTYHSSLILSPINDTMNRQQLPNH